MNRKLVKQGAATLMISLPSKWTKAQNLGKGDEVSIEESKNSLIISKGAEEKAKKHAKITLSNSTESSTRTVIVNAYRAGYDIIEIYYQDEKQYKILLNTLKDYIIGFDITKKEKERCIIENITEPSEEQFEILFKKILYKISVLIDGTRERLKQNSKFEEYKEVVMSIHQYDNFCRRVISKRNLPESTENLLWTFLALLIHGQRELYHLNRFLDNNKVQFRNFEFYDSMKELFNNMQEGCIKKDVSKLEKVHEMEKKIIYDQLYKLIQKNQKENIVLFHLAAAVKDFYLATSPMIGLLLESSVSK